jgi:predicted kinase
MTVDGVIVLTGPPCSGKSSVLRELRDSPRFSMAAVTFVEVDAVFDLLFPDSDRGRKDRLLAYDGAHLLAAMLAKTRTVVLECTYARTEQRASLRDALASINVPVWVIEFHVSPDEAVRRFLSRDQQTDLDEAAVRERVEEFPYSDEIRGVESASATPSEHGRDLEEWLRAAPPVTDLQGWCTAGRSWN